MSSVQRYTRQVPLSTTYYSLPSGSAVYQMIPGSGNVVGNYPNTTGYMSAYTYTVSGAVMARDMGKTIYAPVDSLTGNAGWFRQIQILKPSAVTNAQGFIGGTAGQTFGVVGDANTPNSNMDYFTVYIPVPVGGILSGSLTTCTSIAGGQL